MLYIGRASEEIKTLIFHSINDCFAKSKPWINQDINISHAAGDSNKRDKGVTFIIIGRREELHITKGCHNKPWKKHTV